MTEFSDQPRDVYIKIKLQIIFSMMIERIWVLDVSKASQ